MVAQVNLINIFCRRLTIYLLSSLISLKKSMEFLDFSFYVFFYFSIFNFGSDFGFACSSAQSHRDASHRFFDETSKNLLTTFVSRKQLTVLMLFCCTLLYLMLCVMFVIS